MLTASHQALAPSLLARQTDLAEASDSLSGSDYLAACIALIAGFVIGSLVSRILTSQLTKEGRPDALQKSAKALSSLVFAVFVVIGLIVGLGIIDPPALDDLKSSLIAYIPKALSAAIVVIGASVASEVISTVLERSIGQLPAATQGRILSTVKGIIMGFAVLIAASQLGVDTTIIQLAAAALFFGIALAAALMAGLGGREVAAQLAAGRALRRTLAPDDQIQIADVAGKIVEMHPTSVEVVNQRTQAVQLLPNQLVLDATVGLNRAERSSGADDPDASTAPSS